MANRRPLVVVAGEVKELPSGDTVDGTATGTAISALSAAAALTGAELIPMVQAGATVQAPASVLVPLPWVAIQVISGTTAALTPAAASAAVGAELYATSKTTRLKLDLAWATEVRITAQVIATGNATGAAFKLSYCTAEASTWASGTGVADAGASVVVGATGGGAGVKHDSGWQSLDAGARINDCYLALLVGVALSTTAPTVGAVTVYFR